MRKQICLATLVFVGLMVNACGGKYDAVENTLTDYADAMEAYVVSMDKAVVDAARLNQRVQGVDFRHVHRPVPRHGDGKRLQARLVGRRGAPSHHLTGRAAVDLIADIRTIRQGTGTRVSAGRDGVLPGHP